MEIAVVVDIFEQRALQGYSHSKKQAEVIVTTDLAEATVAVKAGKNHSNNELPACYLTAPD